MTWHSVPFRTTLEGKAFCVHSAAAQRDQLACPVLFHPKNGGQVRAAELLVTACMHACIHACDT